MRKTLMLASAMPMLAAARPRAVRGTVRADGPDDPKALIEQIQTAFAEFKVQNDARLKQIEGRGEDPITAEQVAKINDDLTAATKAIETLQAAAAANRLGGGSGAVLSPEAAEHAKAFNQFFRRGAEAGLADLEVKAGLTTQSDPDGGYLVPEEMESTIDRVLGTVSTMRSLSRVIGISTDSYKKLVNVGGATSGWVGEEESRADTDTPQLREILLNVHEIYAQPVATQKALDDARLDVAAWLADEVSIEFAEQEGDAFVNGNGVKRPRGILQYDTVANASYAWGSLGFVVTGHASSFVAPTASVNPADCLISLLYALKQGYRNGASFLMSDATMGTVRSFKDANGAYIWAPPSSTAEVATILGKPVATDDNMPAVGANAFPIAFGNFQRGYTILDRFGVRVLRDPFTSKPNVKFYTTKRVGGGVTNFEAIKLLKVST